MNKIIIALLIPLLSMGQITEAEPTELSTRIGARLFTFNGVVIGAVALDKLPIENGEQYHSLNWTNDRYDENGSRTSIKFKSTSEDIESLFNIMRRVIKTGEGKNIKLQDKVVTIEPFTKNILMFKTEVDDKMKYFFLKPRGIYALFGKTFNKKDWNKF